MHAGFPVPRRSRLRDEGGPCDLRTFLFGLTRCSSTRNAFFRRVLRTCPSSRCKMGTAEFHYRLERYHGGAEKTLGQGEVSVLAAAWRLRGAVYTSSPGDSSSDEWSPRCRLGGRRGDVRTSPSNRERGTAAIVYDAKAPRGKSGVWILGGRVGRRNFHAPDPSRRSRRSSASTRRGTTNFLQVTDARPDTGGRCPVRTPSEAVLRGEVDSGQAPRYGVCYLGLHRGAAPPLRLRVSDPGGKRTRRRLYDRGRDAGGSWGRRYRKAVNAGRGGRRSGRSRGRSKPDVGAGFQGFPVRTGDKDGASSFPRPRRRASRPVEGGADAEAPGKMFERSWTESARSGGASGKRVDSPGFRGHCAPASRASL